MVLLSAIVIKSAVSGQPFRDALGERFLARRQEDIICEPRLLKTKAAGHLYNALESTLPLLNFGIH